MIADEAGARRWLEGLPGCDAEAMHRLIRLVALLEAENSRQNLVSSRSLAAIWRRHIADSAQLLAHVPPGIAGSWLDLGTGAGFPGLVIAILRPDLDLCLVESRKRRIDWLTAASRDLGLFRVRVLGGRLEAIETFAAAVISARAFAPLPRLVTLAARFSTRETLWLLPKGRAAAHELRDIASAGWQHMFHVEQSLTDPDAGVIIGRLLGKGRA